MLLKRKSKRLVVYAVVSLQTSLFNSLWLMVLELSAFLYVCDVVRLVIQKEAKENTFGECVMLRWWPKLQRMCCTQGRLIKRSAKTQTRKLFRILLMITGVPLIDYNKRMWANANHILHKVFLIFLQGLF